MTPRTRSLCLAIAFLTIAAIALGGITRLRMDVDILELLPPDLEEVQGLSLFLNHLTTRDEIVITLEGNELDGVESAHRRLSEVLRQDPRLGTPVVQSVWNADSTKPLAELVAWLMVNNEPATLQAALERLSPEQRDAVLSEAIDTIASSLMVEETLTLSYDPFQLTKALTGKEGSGLDPGEGGDEFVSADGLFRVIYLRAPPGQSAAFREIIDWVQGVKNVVATWQTSSPEARGIDIGFTGEPVFAAEISASMAGDMRKSGLTAILLTAGVFVWMYRRLRPLLGLILCLGLTFLFTLGLSGWLLPSITVMSVGFASILIGLTVDYGVILYQASAGHDISGRELRRRCGRSIFWAAATTATAFAALGFSMLPGIATLGQLVALGIGTGALVMMTVFPSQVFGVGRAGSGEAASHSRIAALFASPWTPRLALIGLALLILPMAWRGLPGFDTSTRPLRPRHSPAYEVMDRLQDRLLGARASRLALVVLEDRQEANGWRDRFTALEKKGLLTKWSLADLLLPSESNRRANLALLREKLPSSEDVLDAAEAAGFEREALAFTGNVLGVWAGWADEGQASPPSSEATNRFLGQLTATLDDGRHLVVATLEPPEGGGEALWKNLQRIDNLYPVSWPALTEALNEAVPRNLGHVLLWLGAIVLAMLIATFRSWYELFLTLGAVLLSVLGLCGAMVWLGWEWNFFSIAALLLTLGAGLDYSIHVLLDLRRTGDRLDEARRGILQALLVCALSTVAGFASIGWASHQGLASLGRVCALALTINAFVALLILPVAAARWRPASGRRYAAK